MDPMSHFLYHVEKRKETPHKKKHSQGGKIIHYMCVYECLMMVEKASHRREKEEREV